MFEKPAFDELAFFAAVKRRPGLYLGEKSLIHLRDFLSGMDYAFRFSNPQSELRYFAAFVGWYHAHVLCDQSGYACWWNHILYISGGMGDLAFDCFFHKFEAFLEEQHGVSLPDAAPGELHGVWEGEIFSY